MSDLLSPFVVLYEDNADAFWCFEMLLRRMVLSHLCWLYFSIQFCCSTELMKPHLLWLSLAWKFSDGRTDWSHEAVASTVEDPGINRCRNVWTSISYWSRKSSFCFPNVVGAFPTGAILWWGPLHVGGLFLRDVAILRNIGWWLLKLFFVTWLIHVWLPTLRNILTSSLIIKCCSWNLTLLLHA